MNLGLHLPPPLLPPPQSKQSKPYAPNTDLIRRNLINKGVNPTPKILHALRKKQIQKHLRKSNKTTPQPEPESDTDPSLSQFKTIKAEYRVVEDHIELKGRPWERNEVLDFGGLRGEVKGREEYLDELKEVFEERDRLRWVLDDDVEEGENGGEIAVGSKRNVSEEEKILLLVKRLNGADLSIQDWKFSKVMKQSGITFTETHLLKIIERLGKFGNWRLAMSVVEWVYNQKGYKHHKSRFVYTKLLSVLGKARRPNEACQIFKLMRKDGRLYPDMATYHSIAVTLGQAGLVNELISLIECMRQKPSKKNKNMKRKNWDPCLEPDNIIYNAVLNACVPCHQWEAVSWVFQQMRLSGLKPTETTYGLAMEVMLKSGKYDLVHKYFGTMRRGGMALKALTYKVLVRTFWEEGKVDEAIAAVRDMERRGVVGTASVYYELACCLCNKGRWRDAMVEWHLLEHAIDSILEVGEVPQASLFTAIICHTISQQNFDRTVALINCMAHASMSVSESHWTNIFQRHQDLLSMEKFQNLSEHLASSSDLVMEEPVPAFIISAKSYGQIPSDNTLFLDPPRDDSGLQLSGDVPTSGHSKLDLPEMVDSDAVSSTITENENEQPESTLEESSDSSKSDLCLDLLTANIDSTLSKTPSASDILQTWNADRMKDGAYPFHWRNSIC